MGNIRILRRVVILVCFIFFATSISASGQGNTAIADTAWPMYQHDEHHTGRNPYLGIIHQPAILYEQELPMQYGENGGMSIGRDGTIYVAYGGSLNSMDPINRQIRWSIKNGHNRSEPTIGENGKLYWGNSTRFYAVNPDGTIEWSTPDLDANFIFSSNAFLDNNGNIYFTHDGMWSLTSDGNFRWNNMYSEFGQSSPALGLDGTIYGTTTFELIAYNSDGSIKWTKDLPYDAYTSSPVIGDDGTIYLAVDQSIYAYNPNGTIKWEYTYNESTYSGCESFYTDSVIGTDGSIYFAAIWGCSLTEENYLFSLKSDGTLKWKIPIGSVEIHLLLDRANHIFACSNDHYCYGFLPDGTLLWKYLFQIDGQPAYITAPPLIASDGLMYFLLNQNYLAVLYDPTLVPILTASKKDITIKADELTSDITSTIQITSTLASITWTVSLTPTNWITTTRSGGTTPGNLEIHIPASELASGIYHATISIKPVGIVSNWLEIPVFFSKGIKFTYLPIVLK
jgi:hypothetical protein